MSTDITDTQLQQLSKRWAEDPTPHLALQLADVYRHRGQIAEAVPILERGLEVHPGHVSIQVALGRYRLDAGDSQGAADVLREVVDKDPGHLVANKLLVRAHIGLGDSKSAADRLELYALLNDSDPELEALRSAVEAEFSGAAGSTAPPPLPEAFGRVDLVPGTDLAALERPGRRVVTGAFDRDPFAELREAPLEPHGRGGVFGAAMPREPRELPQPAQEHSRLEVEPEPIEQQEPPTIAQVEEEFDSEPAGEALEDQESPAAVESESDGRDEPDELDAGAGATATLGALYLAQGHLTDAKQTFEQVLERDPSDLEALAGLDEVARRTISESSAGPSLSPRTAKIARLEQYLSRIRAAAERLSA